jgi:uncharacterized protein (DUF433 family)
MVKTDSSEVIAAFTEDQTSSLTGVSVRQLRYWDRDGFFIPSLAHEDRSRRYARLYSFRDLVSLKIVNELRNEVGVKLSHLREVKVRLAHLGEDLWAKTTLYVLHKTVVFDNPETHAKEEVVSGQGVLQIPLTVVSGNMRDAVKALFTRDKATIGKIDKRRGRAHGQPVIAGTRIPVSSIQEFSRAGYTIESIKKEYPTLTEEDILAAIKHGEAA